MNIPMFLRKIIDKSKRPNMPAIYFDNIQSNERERVDAVVEIEMFNIYGKSERARVKISFVPFSIIVKSDQKVKYKRTTATSKKRTTPPVGCNVYIDGKLKQRMDSTMPIFRIVAKKDETSSKKKKTEKKTRE